MDRARVYVFYLILAITTFGIAYPLSAEEKSIKVSPQPVLPESNHNENEVAIGVDDEQELFHWWPENLIVAPIPSREPIFGWGLDLVVGVFLDLDKEHPDTPPSQVGVVGWVTQNDSYALGAGGRFNLLNDHLRIDAAAAKLNINYRFYGIGSEAGSNDSYADVNQQMPVYYANAKYQIFPNGYLGLGYLGARADTRIAFSGQEVAPPPEYNGDDNILNIAALEVPFQYDTRDEQLYPRSGWLVNANAIFYNEAVGSDFNTESISIGANHYISVRDQDVLALRAWTQMTGDDAPFLPVKFDWWP